MRPGGRAALLALAYWLWVPYSLAMLALLATGLPGLLAAGLPPSALVLRLADTGLTWLMAALLFWRQGRRGLPLALAYVLISHGVNVSKTMDNWLTLYPILWPLARLPEAIVVGANLPVWATLPDGRFVPRFSRWLAPVAGVMGVVAYVPALSAADSLGARLLALWFPVWQFLAIAFIFIRFFRHADGAQRQQLKWVVYGMAVGIPLLSAGYILPAAWPGEVGALLGDLSSRTALLCGFAAMLIALLRYRLFDIDLIIRRTLVYAVLSGLLALVYFGSVVVLESALRGLTGGGSQAAIVLSTLLIAALFGPLRGRVQRAIDRRFYRRKYDAAHTLAAFGASVRDEVDLDALGQRLTGVVDEAMQPAQVGLWVRAAGKDARLTRRSAPSPTGPEAQ